MIVARITLECEIVEVVRGMNLRNLMIGVGRFLRTSPLVQRPPCRVAAPVTSGRRDRATPVASRLCPVLVHIDAVLSPCAGDRESDVRRIDFQQIAVVQVDALSESREPMERRSWVVRSSEIEKGHARFGVHSDGQRAHVKLGPGFWSAQRLSPVVKGRLTDRRHPIALPPGWKETDPEE